MEHLIVLPHEAIDFALLPFSWIEIHGCYFTIPVQSPNGLMKKVLKPSINVKASSTSHPTVMTMGEEYLPV